MQQHTVFPTRKITMSDTQLTQEERYHIQDLSCHHTIIEWHPITMPFTATFSKIKATAVLCGNISECSKSYFKRYSSAWLWGRMHDRVGIENASPLLSKNSALVMDRLIPLTAKIRKVNTFARIPQIPKCLGGTLGIWGIFKGIRPSETAL